MQIKNAKDKWAMKKRLILICMIGDLLAIGIVPLNLFCFHMPEWTTVILSLLAAGAAVLFALKNKDKKSGAVLLSLLAACSICISLFGSYCNPYWNSITFRSNANYYCGSADTILTYREAKSDLDYAMRYLKKLHPALLNETPDAIQARYDEVVTELSECGQIDINTLCREIESIFSLLGDGHTYVQAAYENTHYLKYNYQRGQDGDTLVSINGTELLSLLREKRSLYSYEAESYGLYLLKNDISSLEGLDYLALSAENGIRYTYADANGVLDTAVYYESDFITYDEYAVYNRLGEDTQTETPSFVSYSIDEENSLAVLTLTACEYNDEYCQTVRQMFTEVKSLGIENIAVDLRDNGGGSSLVANEFIRYLDTDSYHTTTYTQRLGCFTLASGGGSCQNKQYTDLLYHGNVYLLTSANTFSSAMLFAQFIKDNQLGTIIGEAPGNTPNGYGEISMFKLPNSQLYMQISTKTFYRVDQECSDDLIEPDIPCGSEDALDELYRLLSEAAAK